MYSYTAYGLKIQSSLALQEFPVLETHECDVRISCVAGPEPEWASAFQHQDDAFEIHDLEARFWFRDVGSFVLRNGTEVIITPAETVDKDLLRLYVEGMIMAMILHQRGLCVLHASVIEVDGAAVACLGHIRAGKSTIAATMYTRGYRVLSDDNAAIKTDSGPPLVMTGYPYVKLFPAIAELLGFRQGDLSVLHHTQDKMAGAVGNAFSTDPLALRTIYILGHDHASDVTHLSPLDATIELVRNAVPTRWGQPGDARQLQQCAAIAKHVPVFTIRSFRSLPELPGVVDQLERHQRTLQQEIGHCSEMVAVRGASC